MIEMMHYECFCCVYAESIIFYCRSPFEGGRGVRRKKKKKGGGENYMVWWWRCLLIPHFFLSSNRIVMFWWRTSFMRLIQVVTRPTSRLSANSTTIPKLVSFVNSAGSPSPLRTAMIQYLRINFAINVAIRTNARAVRRKRLLRLVKKPVTNMATMSTVCFTSLVSRRFNAVGVNKPYSSNSLNTGLILERSGIPSAI